MTMQVNETKGRKNIGNKNIGDKKGNFPKKKKPFPYLEPLATA